MDQSNSNELANREETGITRVRNYILSPAVVERFEGMMGNGAIFYLNQVLTAVSANPELQKCSPKSVLTAAMTAASLQLSVGPTTGQAFLVPYNGTAQFQIGWKGVYDLAMRTGLYRFINVIDIFEGEEVVEDRMTGMHKIEGKRSGPGYIGFMLYFELMDGFKKTYYMSVEDILDHAKHYSKSYKNPRSLWHDEREKWKMYRKTVLSNGLKKWGRFRASEARMMAEIETDDYASAAAESLPEETEVVEPQQPRRSEKELLGSLGFADEPAEPRKAAAQPGLPLTRKDLTEAYFRLCENAQSIGIQPEKLEARWTEEQIKSKTDALAAAIAARENAIPG